MATVHRPDGSIFFVRSEVPVSQILDSLPSSQELVYIVDQSVWAVDRTWPRFLKGNYLIREREKEYPIVTCCAVL